MSIEFFAPPLALMKHRRFQRSKFHPFPQDIDRVLVSFYCFRYASFTDFKQYGFGYIMHNLYFVVKFEGLGF